jgi:hypothetical protein
MQSTRREFLKTSACVLSGCGVKGAGLLAADNKNVKDPYFLTRGIALVPGDLKGMDWPALAEEAGLTTIGVHGSWSADPKFLSNASSVACRWNMNSTHWTTFCHETCSHRTPLCSGWMRMANGKEARSMVQLPWHQDVFEADLQTYAERGIRHLTSFGVLLDGNYVKKYGIPPIVSYGKAMSRWKSANCQARPRAEASNLR